MKDCAGAGDCFQGCRKDRKQSLNRNFIPETMSAAGTCCRVRRSAASASTGCGPRASSGASATRKHASPGGDFWVRAKRGVIVAASVTKSPVLLATAGVRSPALGKFFRAHPGTPLFGIYDGRST